MNRKIGRHSKGKSHLETLLRVRDWCEKYHVLFKINSVINAYNVDEDMSDHIVKLNPVRWKIFQCKMIDGENHGEKSLRNVEPFLISDQKFKDFVSRHSNVPQLVPESSEMMSRSYLIVDEYFRFLDNGSGKMVPSESILEAGVEKAMKSSGFIKQKYLDRGGRYNWTKEAVCQNQNLEW